MPNTARARLQRNEAPLPNLLKQKGPLECMSTKTYGKLKTRMLPQLRERSDPPPRIMRAGTGDPVEWDTNLQTRGRQYSVIATTPEDLVAKRNVFVHFLPHYKAWYRQRNHAEGMEILAEMMGFPIYNKGDEIDEEDMIAAYNAMAENPEAYVNGLVGLKLQLTSQQQLMRGQVTVEQVRQTFFAHYDSSVVLMRAAQAQRLAERWQAHGFNTLYA